MTVEKGIRIVLGSSICCSILGGILGYCIGMLFPDHYQLVFQIPANRIYQMSSIGGVLGFTQGLGAGIALGLVIVICVTWYEINKLRKHENLESQT